MHFGVGRGDEMHVTCHAADEAVVALARRQHGVISASQLRSAGLGPRAISGRLSRGWLRRLHKGVYLVGALET